jgi:ubiquinone/menaquinone biosynthesis C-methylase UbiE
MTDAESYAQLLLVANPLVEPVVRSAIQALQLPPGSRGLDAGCGIGLQALLLAEAVGPAGHITGLDLSPDHLAYAGEIVERAGLSERISLQVGDMSALPFDDQTFDWAWSKDCLVYSPQVKELARVVKPGGSVVMLFWSSQMLLPGFPLLEARLNGTTSGIAPLAGDSPPEAHPLRGLGWFRDAGLEELSVQTFVRDAHAPLSGELRCALIDLLSQRWPGVESELTQEDWAEHQRLCLPESPDLIVDHPDYYAFITYSMFRGRVARSGGDALGVAGDSR